MENVVYNNIVTTFYINGEWSVTVEDRKFSSFESSSAQMYGTYINQQTAQCRFMGLLSRVIGVAVKRQAQP